MDLAIDLRSAEPSYRQLAGKLRAAIQRGEIRPGEALPSLAYLQQETGLAVNTVRKAIALLADEGLVVTVQGRGTYAAG